MCFFFYERSRKMRSCLYFGTTSLLYLLIVLIFFCITVWPRMIILSFLLHFFSDAFNRSSQSSFPFLLSRHDMDIIMLKIRCSPWEYILIDTIIHTEHSVNANLQQKMLILTNNLDEILWIISGKEAKRMSNISSFSFCGIASDTHCSKPPFLSKN